MKSDAQRIRAIDAVRGGAVISMVFSHGLRWLSPGRSQDIYSFFGSNSIGDLATPLFMVVAGLALGLASFRRLRSLEATLASLAKLFAIGMCLTLGWGVLQAQAVALASLFALFWWAHRRWQAKNAYWALAVFIAIALVAHMLLRAFALGDEELPWNHMMLGGFPVFAVIVLAGVGFLCSSLFRREDWAKRTLPLGLVLLGFAGAGHLIGSMDGMGGRELTGYLLIIGGGVERAGMSGPFLAFGIGLTLTLISLVEPLFSKVGWNQWIKGGLHLVERLGKRALFVFIFHYVAFAMPLHVTGLEGIFPARWAIVGSVMMTFLVVVATERFGMSSRTIYAVVDRAVSQVFDSALPALPSVDSAFRVGATGAPFAPWDIVCDVDRGTRLVSSGSPTPWL